MPNARLREGDCRQDARGWAPSSPSKRPWGWGGGMTATHSLGRASLTKELSRRGGSALEGAARRPEEEAVAMAQGRLERLAHDREQWLAGRRSQLESAAVAGAHSSLDRAPRPEVSTMRAGGREQEEEALQLERENRMLRGLAERLRLELEAAEERARHFKAQVRMLEASGVAEEQHPRREEAWSPPRVSAGGRLALPRSWFGDGGRHQEAHEHHALSIGSTDSVDSGILPQRPDRRRHARPVSVPPLSLAELAQRASSTEEDGEAGQEEEGTEDDWPSDGVPAEEAHGHWDCPEDAGSPGGPMSPGGGLGCFQGAGLRGSTA